MSSPGATDISSADLFAGYQDRIRRYILSIVRDPVEAEDLTQEVFLRAHRKLSSVRHPDAASSWLYRIATHVCYDRFRQWSRQPRLDRLDVSGSLAADAAGGSGEARLERVIERAEMSACVGAFVEELSDEYRQVILLHDLEGLTNPEIAEMLGVSVEAVKIRLHRARRKLEAALAARCDFSHDDHGIFVCEPAAVADTTSRPSSRRRRSPLYPSSSPDRPTGKKRRQRGGAAGTGRSDHDVVE